MIFLIGDIHDEMIASAIEHITRKDYPYICLQPKDIGADSHFLINCGDPCHYYIAYNGQRHNLSAKDIAFVRYSENSDVTLNVYLSVFLRTCPAVVYNSWNEDSLVYSKPLQLIPGRFICDKWRRPKTIIANNWDKVKKYFNEGIITKPMGCIKSNAEVCDNNYKIKNYPTMFQELVMPSRNLKVHNFKDKVCVTQICSDVADYRADGANNHFFNLKPSAEITALAEDIRQNTGMKYFDFDLVGSPSNEVFLEVNSSPVPTYFDRMAESKIKENIFELMFNI